MANKISAAKVKIVEEYIQAIDDELNGESFAFDDNSIFDLLSEIANVFAQELPNLKVKWLSLQDKILVFL